MVFPPPSLAIAPRECFPLETPRVFQEPVYGGMESSVPRFWLSSLNWTLVTAILSLAMAERATVPVTVVPVLGAVMDTVGLTVSAVASVLKVWSVEVE